MLFYTYVSIPSLPGNTTGNVLFCGYSKMLSHPALPLGKWSISHSILQMKEVIPGAFLLSELSLLSFQLNPK